METNGQYSKLITDIPDVDIAISMGCNVGCPFIAVAYGGCSQADTCLLCHADKRCGL